MRAEANMIAVIGLRLLIKLIGTKNCGHSWVRDIPGAQRRMRPANIDAALRPLLLR